MWMKLNKTLLAVTAASVAAMSVAPAFADGYRHGNRGGKHRTVTVVQKVVHVHARPQPVRTVRVVHRPVYQPVRTVKVVHHYRAPVVHHSYYPVAYSGDRVLAGGLLGAAIGALAGNAIGKGSGHTAAIVGGAVFGGLIGGSIGSSMNKVDQLQAAEAIETTRTGATVEWVNPDSGAQYSVTPTRTYVNEAGMNCREYTTWGWIGGYEEKLYGNACRMADGSWKQVG